MVSTSIPTSKSSNPAPVLVTGGAGYIGSFTVRALLEGGYSVVVLDNLSQGHRESVPKTAPLAKIDLRDASALADFFSSNSFDGVIHFAADALVGESVRDPLKYYRNNFIGTFNLIEQIVKHNISKFIFSSTCATYGNPVADLNESHPQNPINPYGNSKLAVELMVRDCARAHNLRGIALRYFNACGAAPDGSLGEDHSPESHLIPLAMGAALGMRPPLQVFGADYPTPDGSCVRDYVHVVDLAAAHLAAYQSLATRNPHYFDAFNIGTGRGYSVKEVMAAIHRVTGKQVPHAIAPRREGDPASLVSMATKLQRELGWKPQRSELDTVIRDVNAWMTKHPGGFKS